MELKIVNKEYLEGDVVELTLEIDGHDINYPLSVRSFSFVTNDSDANVGDVFVLKYKERRSDI